MRYSAATASFLWIFISSPSLSQDEFYEISLEYARCIQAHAESYIEHSGRPILIAPEYCPEHDLQEILSGQVKNCASCTKTESIGIIRISPEDLACFSSLKLASEVDPYLMPVEDGWCQ